MPVYLSLRSQLVIVLPVCLSLHCQSGIVLPVYLSLHSQSGIVLPVCLSLHSQSGIVLPVCVYACLSLSPLSVRDSQDRLLTSQLTDYKTRHLQMRGDLQLYLSGLGVC